MSVQGTVTQSVEEIIRKHVAENMLYTDGPLPIGLGQTISQPYMVAAMTEMLELKGNENVFEVGTGSGYQAAVLGELAGTVHTVERHPELASRASEVLSGLGYTNILVHVGDGTLGWPPAAPYDAIMVTASAPKVPPSLLEQLNPHGSLVLPVGGKGTQWLEFWQQEHGVWQSEEVMPVAFVPLRGAQGWADWDDQ